MTALTSFSSVLWTEMLKAYRSRVPLVTTLGFMAFPVVGGLFMFIMKDPERAQAMGLVGAKAQLLSGGAADWQSYFDFLSVGSAGAGAIFFAFIIAWIFGREFSDHTAKELLALPIRRSTVVLAKFALSALWIMALVVLLYLVGLGVGAALSLPGGSAELAGASFRSLMISSFLTLLLTPLVAWFAGAGRGYLAPLGWAFGTLGMAQIAGLMGWADRFPWAIPGAYSMMFSVMYGKDVEGLGLHSYVLVVLTCIIGVAATVVWWRSADQSR
jgi:ABC-type transport system involved in multi-copper enzyme maturation permease subunit